ncbi:MAG: DUF3566 domain-containing protein [Actinomycetota bacterium]|nr:DUF3566 domain-containing protein [Actinomycetota bacterium]
MATVRRVRRIIRKIDPWTALKVSSVVWAVLGLALVLGMVIFWSVLDRAGIPDKITEFLVEVTLIAEGSDPFGNTEQFLRFAIFSSVVWWVLMTGITTAFAIVYNLVSDVVGGLEVVVLEETLNPVVTEQGETQQVLHPPADYRTGNGAIVPPEDHADIPTEESDPVGLPETLEQIDA